MPAGGVRTPARYVERGIRERADVRPPDSRTPASSRTNGDPGISVSNCLDAPHPDETVPLDHTQLRRRWGVRPRVWRCARGGPTRPLPSCRAHPAASPSSRCPARDRGGRDIAARPTGDGRRASARAHGCGRWRLPARPDRRALRRHQPAGRGPGRSRDPGHRRAAHRRAPQRQPAHPRGHPADGRSARHPALRQRSRRARRGRLRHGRRQPGLQQPAGDDGRPGPHPRRRRPAHLPGLRLRDHLRPGPRRSEGPSGGAARSRTRTRTPPGSPPHPPRKDGRPAATSS